ncbi:MAG TPA: mersacidin/lichenicidin family type 2 lantibiotic [Thermoanaerobaculia bacterium]|nr:mersacidin/lichenicidin family type 2 lantibiotic [Thermoanaerobaculia bacterium]
MHKTIDVVRAWRDEEYRNSLTEQELASLPANPAGMATVDDSALRSVTGGLRTKMVFEDCTTFVGSCVKPGQQCP